MKFANYIVCSVPSSVGNQRISANEGKIMLSALNVPTLQSYSSYTQENPLDGQNDDNKNSPTDENCPSRYITDEGA